MDLLVEGNEEIFKDGIGEVDGFEEYYDEIIEESDLEDLL